MEFQSRQLALFLDNEKGILSLSASIFTSSPRITPVLYGSALEIIRESRRIETDSAFRVISFLCFNVDYGKDGKLQTGCLYDLMKTADIHGLQPEEKFRSIIDDCAGLLVLERSQPGKLDLDKDSIRPIHPSLLDCVRNADSLLPVSVKSRLNQQRTFIMQLFLRYLNEDIFWTSPKHFETQKDIDDFKRAHPGFFYAASEWGFSGRFRNENGSNNLLLSALIRRVQSAPTTPLFLIVRLSKSFALRDDPIKPSSLLECLRGNPDPGYTLTHVAASFGSVKLLEFLTTMGVLQLDTEDSFGMTPLIHAIVSAGTRPAVSDLLDTISWLLSADSGALGSNGRAMGGIALWYAFSRKQLAIMEALGRFYVASLGTENTEISKSWIPWQLKVLERALEKVSEDFFETVAVLIIESFPGFVELWKLYNQDMKHKQSPLHIAASTGSYKVVNAIIKYRYQIGRSEIFTQPSALSLALTGMLDCYGGQTIVRSDKLDQLNGYELSAASLISMKSPRVLFDFVVLADTDTQIEGTLEVDPVSINIRAFV